MSGGNGDQPNPGTRAAASSGAAGGAQLAGAAVALLILAAGVLAPVWAREYHAPSITGGAEVVLLSPEASAAAVEQLRLEAAGWATEFRSYCWNRGTAESPDWMHNATVQFFEERGGRNMTLPCYTQTDFALVPETQGGRWAAYKDLLIIRGASAQPGEARVQVYPLDYGRPRDNTYPFFDESIRPCVLPVDDDGAWVVARSVTQAKAGPHHYLVLVEHPPHPWTEERQPEAWVVTIDHTGSQLIEFHEFSAVDKLEPMLNGGSCQAMERDEGKVR